MVKFLQRYFLTGLLAITPLALTSWFLWRFYEMISATMRPWLTRVPALTDAYPDFFLTIIGVAVFVLLITLVGLFTRNLIGIAFFRLLERFFQQIPIVKGLFSVLQQLSSVFLQDQRKAFQKVVLFAYPRPGLYSLGFVTRDEAADTLVTVFLPTAPNPTSGYMLLVPREEAMVVDIAIEDAVKLIVSGGSIMSTAQIDELQMRVAGLAAAPPAPDSTTQDGPGDGAA